MFKLNFKLLLALLLSLLFTDVFCQKQICKCERINNYKYSDYQYEWKTFLFDINSAIENIEKKRWSLNTKEDYESVYAKISGYLSELPPPYSVNKETKLTNFLPPNWAEDDPGIYSILFIKKPFNTYIDEQKNFDVMFGLQEVNNERLPFLVVKNYFKNHEYQSLAHPTLVIDDDEFSLSTELTGFGTVYKNNTLTIKNGPSVIGYRTTKIIRIPFHIYHGFGEQFISTIIEKIKPGKVFITYETSTGQIKRTFTEAQIKSLKEMLQIYYNFQFDKFTVTYLNEQVKKDCQEMEARVEEANKEHYIRLQPIIDRVNEVMEKYKKF